jgi:hypothetical protein
MGIMRKLASASTLGGVKYTSKREAQTKAAAAQARAANEEAKLAKAQRKGTKVTLGSVISAAADKRAAREAAPAHGIEERMAKLVTLHGSGVITDEEFAAKRAEILESL